MKPSLARGLSLVVAFCVLVGAGVRADEPRKNTTKSRPSPPVRRGPSDPSDAECVALANSMMQAVQGNDATKFSRSIDWAAMLERATSGLGTPEIRTKLSLGALQNLSRGDGFATQLTKNVGGGGSFEFLRLSRKGENRSALFRLLQADGAMNYLDFEFERRPGGEIKVIDIYPVATGELMSQTLRRAFIPVAADASRGLVAKLTTSESDYTKNIGNLAAMTQALNQGRPDETLAIYRKLPASLQKDKTCLLLRLRASMAVNEAEYKNAIDAMEQNFPKDPALDLIMLDGYFLRKEFDKTLATIDRVDKNIGGDPYLDVLRASSYAEKGDLKNARSSAEKAVSGVPYLVNAHWTLIAITLRQKDFQATLEGLKAVDQTFEVDFNDLTQAPEYAGFCKSPQYREWTRYLDEKGKKAGGPGAATPKA